MCLITQGKIIKLKEKFADVDFKGIIKEVDISTLKEAGNGDEILVFSGKAIEKVKNE